MRLASGLLIVASLSIAGCAAQARSPEPVSVGQVACARCRMVVSSQTGAGEIVSARDETRVYDDIGCLAADWPGHGGDANAFVYVGGALHDVETVWFARQAGARTAMAFGFVAFATADQAKAVDRDGRALAWTDVVRLAGR